MSNYQKMISDMLNKINDKYKILDKVSEKLSKYPKLDKINTKINKYIKKNNPVKVKPEIVYNHQAVESSMAVKMLKKKFENALRGEESETIIEQNKNGTYEIFVDYLKRKESLELSFPANTIESDLGISRNKRLKFCGQAVEEGLLYKPTSNSFDWIKNKEVNDNE